MAYCSSSSSVSRLTGSNFQNSLFSCPCDSCWSSSSPFPRKNSHWLGVEFQKCPPLSELLERQLREKVAEWLNQECAIVLDCRQFSQETFTKNHVVIGGLDCQENQGPGILYLNVLISDTVTEVDDGELSYRNYFW